MFNGVAFDRTFRLAIVIAIHGGLAALLLGGGRAPGVSTETSIDMTLVSASAQHRARPVPSTRPVPTQPAPSQTTASTVAPAAEPMDGPVTTSVPQWTAGSAKNPWPAYPTASRRLREEGEVRLRVHVSGDGLAADVQIQKSSGFQRLDLAARNAVAHWHFVPARRGADAVDAWVLIPIVFTLEN